MERLKWVGREMIPLNLGLVGVWPTVRRHLSHVSWGQGWVLSVWLLSSPTQWHLDPPRMPRFQGHQQAPWQNPASLPLLSTARHRTGSWRRWGIFLSFEVRRGHRSSSAGGTTIKRCSGGLLKKWVWPQLQMNSVQGQNQMDEDPIQLCL